MSTAWYAHFPADAYALGPFRFDRPMSRRSFLAYLRQWEGVTRLPRGVQVWTAQ